MLTPLQLLAYPNVKQKPDGQHNGLGKKCYPKIFYCGFFFFFSLNHNDEKVLCQFQTAF